MAALLRLTEPGTAADLPVVMPVKAPPVSNVYDWTGFYLGGHLGYAWGDSRWTASSPAAPTPSMSGSINLFQTFDGFKETGGFFEGVQAGYNYILPNRFVVGAEVRRFQAFSIWTGFASAAPRGRTSANLESVVKLFNFKLYRRPGGGLPLLLGTAPDRRNRRNASPPQ